MLCFLDTGIHTGQQVRRSVVAVMWGVVCVSRLPRRKIAQRPTPHTTTAMSPRQDFMFLVASFGATAVLLYSSHTSPLAQPRNVLVGHFVSSVAGVTVYKVRFCYCIRKTCMHAFDCWIEVIRRLHVFDWVLVRSSKRLIPTNRTEQIMGDVQPYLAAGFAVGLAIFFMERTNSVRIVVLEWYCGCRMLLLPFGRPVPVHL